MRGHDIWIWMNIYKSNLKRKVSVKKFATTNNERNCLILSSLIVKVAGYKDEKCKKIRVWGDSSILFN